MPQIRKAQEGFGIVVVALLFTAFAVVAAAAIDRSSVQVEQNRQRLAETQLSRLSIALAKYARYNDHRLPCPASWAITPSDVSGDFGSAVNANVCSGVGAAPAGTERASDNTAILIGMVPVRELVGYGISYNDAFDPWGSRVLYAVARGVTPGTTDGDVAAAPRPSVTDYLTGEVQTAPDMVLVSLGRDRMGGRLRNQASLASPSIACSGGRRAINCDNNSAFIRGPLMTTSRASDTMYFDDSISTLRYTP